MDIDSTWPIPDDLSPQGRKAAEIIRGFLADSGMADHGGGDASTAHSSGATAARATAPAPS